MDKKILIIIFALIIIISFSGCIETSDILQERAKTVGYQTIREVSAGIKIDSITGYTDEEKTKIEYLAFGISPRAGSKNINISEITSEIQYQNTTKLSLNNSLINSIDFDNYSIFNTPIKNHNNSNKYTILDNLTNNSFGIITIHDPDFSIISNYCMNSGDRAYLIINLTSVIDNIGLLPEEEISGSIIPELGKEADFYFITPKIFSERVIILS